MATRERFSERHGFKASEPPITVRFEAPEHLRGVVVDIAYEFELRPSELRTVVCRVLRKRPDDSNRSERPNIDHEVRSIVDGAEWYRVYDVVEEIYHYLDQRASSDSNEHSPEEPRRYATEMNKYFREAGVGWQFVKGELQFRGDDAFESSVRSANRELRQKKRKTSADELEHARNDLSRRPNPDVTGAVQHALAALECLARDVTGDSQATLGKLLKKHNTLLPAPLDAAVDKLWGFASERGRHLREGREPNLTEAQLIVGVVAALCTFLSSEN
jgi:hypothetical protein